MTSENENVRGDRQTDLRLRILGYHVGLIAGLKPGEAGTTLHTVQGFDCKISRDKAGEYTIGIFRFSRVESAIAHYCKLLDSIATGLHSDND